jgi:hypothetical protein
MDWYDFYNDYCDMAPAQLKKSIASLEYVGSGDEVVDAVVDIEDKSIKTLLVKKAMELDVIFTESDYYRLEDEISSELHVKIAREGNIEFGSSDDVAQVLASIFDDAANDALYKRAVASGVKFTQEQLDWIRPDSVCRDEEEEEIQTTQNPGCGCLVFLLGLSLLSNATSDKSNHHSGGYSSSSSNTRKRHNGHCDGDCANCPPHYGYRYGRWYYGHGHNHGCVFGGNKGGGGPD